MGQLGRGPGAGERGMGGAGLDWLLSCPRATGAPRGGTASRIVSPHTAELVKHLLPQMAGGGWWLWGFLDSSAEWHGRVFVERVLAVGLAALLN